jgi:hypothetical protein
MPVPSYAVIADSEIDPESPVTSSLMFRLRDNILAILGIDPSDPTPTFTLSPSLLQLVETTTLVAAAGTDTAEARISHLADSVEENLIASLSANPYSVHIESTGGAGVLNLKIDGADVHYASGSPDGITITATQIGARTIGGTGPLNGLTAYQTTNYLVPSDNAWHVLVNDGAVNTFQVKCRATSTDLYLTFRSAPGGNGRVCDILFQVQRRIFTAKG